MLQTASFSAKRFPYHYFYDTSAYAGVFHYTYYGKDLPGFMLTIIAY